MYIKEKKELQSFNKQSPGEYIKLAAIYFRQFYFNLFVFSSSHFSSLLFKAFKLVDFFESPLTRKI